MIMLSTIYEAYHTLGNVLTSISNTWQQYWVVRNFISIPQMQVKERNLQRRVIKDIQKMLEGEFKSKYLCTGSFLFS